MSERVLIVHLYPRRTQPPCPPGAKVFTVFEGKDRVPSLADEPEEERGKRTNPHAATVDAFLGAARGISCIVMGVDRFLNSVLLGALRVTLRPGEWCCANRPVARGEPRSRVTVVRAASDQHMAMPWFAPPATDGQFHGGALQQARRVGIVPALTTKTPTATIQMACMGVLREWGEYKSFANAIYFAGGGAIPDSLKGIARRIQIPFVRRMASGDGEAREWRDVYPEETAREWRDAIRDAKGRVLIVGPSFFLGDLYRYIVSRSNPVGAIAEAAGAIERAFGAAFLVGDPILRPLDRPEVEGGLVVK